MQLSKESTTRMFPCLLLVVSVTAELSSQDTLLMLPSPDNLFNNTGARSLKNFLGESKKKRPVLTKEERFQAKLESFDNKTEEIKNHEDYLEIQGINLKSAIADLNTSRPIAFLKQKAKKGLLLTVENLSERVLGSPTVNVRCGWQDDKLGEVHGLNSTEKEIIGFHNFKKSMRSSCGSVSWQLQDRSGRAVRVAGGDGLRMFLTWSLLDTGLGPNKCAHNKRNEAVIGFAKVSLDTEGRELDWEESEVYSDHHTKQGLATTFQSDPASLTSILDSPDDSLQVKLVMGAGCLTDMNVTVLGKHKAALQIVSQEEEVFTSDQIWEQMIRQAWLDIVNTINRDKALYGVSLKPLLLEPLLGVPISISEDMAGYHVDLAMWNISIHGLDTLNLERLTLERGEALNNLRERSIIDIGNLTVQGMYQYTAQCTNWFCIISDFDSEGEQPFRIDMIGAKLNIIIKFDTVTGCGATHNLVLKDIQLPIDYDNIVFDFTNIGSVLGSIVDTIGNLALSFSQSIIRSGVEDVLRREVPSLLCQEMEAEVSKMEAAPATVNKDKEPDWHSLLVQGSRGWGWDQLRRDYLAENFMLKVINEGFVRHLTNDSDPIVKALDPFQLLPASEDIHEKGLIKGHIVACDLWLGGLRNLRLTDMELVRNDDLTYSALKLRISLPSVNLTGKFRLSHVQVLSFLQVTDREGSVEAEVSGVTLELYCVLQTNRTLTQGLSSSQIKITHFSVRFLKEKANIDVKGLGGKIMSKLTNKGIKAIGDKVITMQQAAIDTEIRNILWGLVKCVMYKPGMDFQKCQDQFWECLGFKVPFEFPQCSAMYAEAEENISKFPTYRDYLDDYKGKQAQKNAEKSRRNCLEI